MKTFTFNPSGAPAPISLVVTNQALDAWAIPYAFVSNVLARRDCVAIEYSGREIVLGGANLVRIGIGIADRELAFIQTRARHPGDDPAESVVHAVAPAPEPDEKVKRWRYDVLAFEEVDDESSDEKRILRSLKLADSAAVTLHAPSYHYFHAMEFTKGRIAIDYTGHRIELHGLNTERRMDRLWAALCTHRAISIAVAPRSKA